MTPDRGARGGKGDRENAGKAWIEQATQGDRFNKLSEKSLIEIGDLIIGRHTMAVSIILRCTRRRAFRSFSNLIDQGQKDNVVWG